MPRPKVWGDFTMDDAFEGTDDAGDDLVEFTCPYNCGKPIRMTERVKADDTYERAWNAALEKESHAGAARYEGLLLVELPALPTLVAVGQAGDTKLVKLHEGGATRVAV